MVRKRIALVFIGNYKSWSGGIIYILNLIQTFNEFEFESKPEILVIHSQDSPIEDIIKINYPFIEFQLYNPNKIHLLFNAVSRRILGRNLIKSKILGQIPASIYPYNAHLAFEDIPKKIYWIPDFQYLHLPQMFSSKELNSTFKRHLYISTLSDTVVFSSNDAKNDYVTNFPDFKNKLELLKFAQKLPEFNQLDIITIKEKYKVDRPYFFVPNQFWKHKNHITVLKAIKQARKNYKDLLVVFTGNENDHRNLLHIVTLRNYIIENELETNLRFLGFIDRLEQLVLMNNSIAIIQPSLFEGWSTVVEDAKALNKHIILSDLPIHKEQINLNCTFFESNNVSELSEKLITFANTKTQVISYDYNKNILDFKIRLQEILLNN